MKGEHGESSTNDSHGQAAGHESGEHHQEFNWYHGFLGEKEGVEPGLLWREPGAPAPFGGLLLNTALLVFLFVKFGAGKITQGLAKRRKDLLAGIDAAGAMQSEAEASLASHQKLLDNLDSEVARVREEMSRSAEQERERVLTETKATRSRLEAEARKLVSQELAAAKQRLHREASLAALARARELVTSEISADDDRRICDEYVGNFPVGAQGANPLSTATTHGGVSQ